MPNPSNKIIFTPTQVNFLTNNYLNHTNKELAAMLGLKQTVVRIKLYSLGLKKFIKQPWTPEQVSFLEDNYTIKGDTEIAEIFDIIHSKKNGWSKKHIEKKRRYLKLKRNINQINQIRERNRLMGRWKLDNCYSTQNQIKVGVKRIWFPSLLPRVVIKTKNGFESYSRFLWLKHKGPIPKNMKVRIMCDDKINYTIDDLKLVSFAENAYLNSINRTPPELKHTKQLINKLTKKIIKDGKQHSSSR